MTSFCLILVCQEENGIRLLVAALQVSELGIMPSYYGNFHCGLVARLSYE